MSSTGARGYSGQPLLIGCDIGTSAVKAVLTTPDGDLVARQIAEHPMHRPHPGWAENDPEDWYDGVTGVVRGLLKASGVAASRVAALGVVAQREPVVLLDGSGRVLTPSISWTDHRTYREAQEVCDRFGRTWLIDRTGMAPVPGATLTHLMWLRRHRNADFAQARRIIFAKDFILERLTGERGTDGSTPGRSLMLDIHQGEYAAEICSASEIDAGALSPITRRAWEAIGTLRPNWADEFGLGRQTIVATGGADDAAATLGGGATETGQLCLGTGTATNWRLVCDSVKPDETGRGDLAPHVVPGRYIFEVAIESTGSSLRWLRETFGLGASFAELLEEAEKIPPGADGLMFLPFVDGAGRAPWYVEGAAGALLGIVSGHRRGHFVRAVLEGVAHQYPRTLEIVASRSPVRPPFVTGDGETGSPLWTQIKADVLGVPLAVPKIPHLAAAGAAILAGVAAGIFADVQSGARAFVETERIFEPDSGRHARYRELRASYEETLADVLPAVTARRNQSTDSNQE